MIESKEWYLSHYAPQGIPTSEHVKLRSLRVPTSPEDLPDGHVTIEVLLLSVDPYVRTRMTGQEEGLYFPQFNLNEVIQEFGIGRVVCSKDDKFKKGDIVTHPYIPVAEYCVVPSTPLLNRVDLAAGVELPDYLSAIGIPGFAAWLGIEVIGDVKPGDNVFISAAGGGVGMFAGQLAKLKGCRVVGSTGSDEKVKIVKDEFGYDDAFNYNKETDYDAALSKYFPNGIDVYFENVGGKMLEAVLNHVNNRARIPICGMISQYNKAWTERDGVRNLLNAVGKGVRLEGFIIGLHLDKFGEFTKEMGDYVKQGKIKSKHKIYHGIESFLESLCSLFSKSNAGKVIVQVKS